MMWSEPRWLTPEELVAEEAEAARAVAELDARWPRSQRRYRCPCGAFAKKPGDAWRTWQCKNCGTRMT